MPIKMVCSSSLRHALKTRKFSDRLHIAIDAKPFDVTLRDGLQGLSLSEQSIFQLDKKKEIYNEILSRYNPSTIEIGSCVNNKILPVFNDIREFVEYTNGLNNNKNHYVLTPNLNKLTECVDLGIKNFSFITSVSDSFQLKNTKKTLSENYAELNKMVLFLENSVKEYSIKLYVSCINECPIQGKIDTTSIVSELFSLSMLNISNICLSDTCGTLTHSNFIDIVENMKKIGLNMDTFSLHLHVMPHREKEIEQIFHTALDNGINKFDVSLLNTGGCSVTMDGSKLLPNMSYDQYYKFLINYLGG